MALLQPQDLLRPEDITNIVSARRFLHQKDEVAKYQQRVHKWLGISLLALACAATVSRIILPCTHQPSHTWIVISALILGMIVWLTTETRLIIASPDATHRYRSLHNPVQTSVFVLGVMLNWWFFQIMEHVNGWASALWLGVYVCTLIIISAFSLWLLNLAENWVIHNILRVATKRRAQK